MRKDFFYINNKMTFILEHMIDGIDSLDEFEARFSDDFLNDDDHIGNYLSELLIVRG